MVRVEEVSTANADAFPVSLPDSSGDDNDESPAQPTMDEKTIAEGMECLAEGKRLMKCANLVEAVKKLSDACEKLVEAYGQLAPETADAYFNYGIALLDLARLDAAVIANENLGHGAASTSGSASTEQNGECEKPTSTTTTTDNGDVQEETVSSTSPPKGDAPPSDSSPEKSSTKADADHGTDVEMASKEVVTQGEAVETVQSVDTEDPSIEKSDVKADGNIEADNESSETAAAESTEAPANSDSVSKNTNEEGTADDASAPVKAVEEGQCDGDTKDKAGNGTFVPPKAAMELVDALKSSRQEGDDESEDDEEDDDDDEADECNDSQDEEISNIELAWENLDLARVIYEKAGDMLKVADCKLRLAEVSMESENFPDALSDLESCLSIRRSKLEPLDRSIAETYFQMGLCTSNMKEYKQSEKYLRTCAQILMDRCGQLAEKAFSKDVPEEDRKSAEDEKNELEEIIKDVLERASDASTCQDITPEEQTEIAMTTSPVKKQTSKPESENSNIPVHDISNLVRKPAKRIGDVVEAGAAKRVKFDTVEVEQVVQEPVENGAANGHV